MAGDLTGLGGFTGSLGETTGTAMVEGGVRITKRTMVFGNFGRFANLQAERQPTLDSATAAFSANEGLEVIASGTLPAWYGIGGLRVEVPAGNRVLPYVLGGVGFAHLNPTPEFSFASGTMPDGSTPAVGVDVTSMLESAGTFVEPPSSTSFMFMLGGGVQVPVTPHWIVDAGYRYSRISADSTLNTLALNTNGMTFGFGYRF